MGTVENGRVDLFWLAVSRVAARHLDGRYRIERDDYLLVTADDAILSLASLWTEMRACSPDLWGGEIERHLGACIRLIEQVADLDIDQGFGPNAGAGPTFRLRLARSKRQSVAFDLGAGWELRVVVDLGLGLLPITHAHVARWRAGSPPASVVTAPELLQSVRQATLDAARPRLAAARVGPGLALLSAGSHTAGCLLDLDRLASAIDLAPTLVLPLSPSVVALAGSTERVPDRPATPMARAMAALRHELGPAAEWPDVPLWQFHSPGRLDIFEV